MVSNAAMMYGMMPNMYYNQVALNDLTDMNSYTMLNPYMTDPMYSMMNPMMSMNGSIFGGGMMPGMFNPAFGSGQNYWQYYDQYQNAMTDNMVRQQERMRNADLRLNSPQEGILKQAELLHDKILRDEQEQIQIAYKQFIDSVKAMYPNADPEQIENRAEQIYKSINQTGLFDDIRKNGRGSFTQGFLQTATFGLADQKTAEENVSDLTGLPVGRAEKGKKFAGNVLGGAAVGGAVTLATIPLLKALKIGAKSKTMWGLLAGTAAGILAAIAGSKS